jgi:hypothetical protein
MASASRARFAFLRFALALRGCDVILAAAAALVVIDEASRVDDELLTAVRPMKR